MVRASRRRSEGCEFDSRSIPDCGFEFAIKLEYSKQFTFKLEIRVHNNRSPVHRIYLVLLIYMPIPFKFDSCKNFATNLNAASSLGLGSKKCSLKHFTLVNSIPSVLARD